MSANATRWTAYRTYLRVVRGGMVGDIGFILDDFKTYIAGLRKPDWKKIFPTVIDDHHEMFVRLSKRRFDPMNEHDVVRVKKTVTATPWFEYDPIEIQSGWEGTIVALADTPSPCIAFNEKYRGKPFLVHLDATNLEVVKIIPVSESIQNQHWLEILSNGKNTYVTSYKGVFVEISYIELENSDFNLTLDWYTVENKNGMVHKKNSRKISQLTR